MDNNFYELYKYILIEYIYILIEHIYIYNAVANKRVMHLMKHGRTERIRKKNRNRFYSEWKLFVKKRIKK